MPRRERMTGKIPQAFIDDLVSRIDIVDVIDSRVPLRKAGKEYKACCPFHEERTPSFTVSQDKQFYHCFGCGAHGTAIGFLMQYEHMDFREAVDNLAARVGLVPPTETAQASEARSQSVDLLTTLGAADQYYRRQLRKHPEADAAIQYLKSRGITGEIAAEFALGYAPPGWDHLLHALGTDPERREALCRAGLLVKKESGSYYDRFRNRVIFPIHDHRGRVVGFGARALGDEVPKYMNSPESPVFHKGAELYRLYQARGPMREQQYAIVVEGYMDAISLAQYGIRHVVATLGTATTRAHLDRLFRHCPEVIFCFDGDLAGREAAWRAMETSLPVLRNGRQVGFLFLPDGHDPDTLIRAEGAKPFEQRVRESTPLPVYLMQSLAKQVDLARLDGRARLIELAKPLIRQIPPGALRHLMFDSLAEMAQADRKTIDRVLDDGDRRQSRHRAVDTPQTPATPQPTTPLQVALSMLLQQPVLARIAGDIEPLQHLDNPGAGILVSVIHLIREHPGLTTPAILERYRDSPYFLRLNQLACHQHLLDESALEREFITKINNLRFDAEKTRVSALLAKAESGALSEQEKAELPEALRHLDRLGRERNR